MPTPDYNPLSARYVAICTAAVEDGQFFTSDHCVAIGVLADGTEAPTPEAGTFSTMEGQVGTSATLAHTYRIGRFVKGDVDAVRGVRNLAGVVCAVISKSRGSYTNCGPGILSSVTPIGNNPSNEPGGARVVFGGDEDFPESVYQVLDQAAVVEAAA